ncbi:LPS export ABC transporter periplasmic protein LptC [bacterium]|nr:LPS export ABC transporter periplasmic protein LptC [bacterium]
MTGCRKRYTGFLLLCLAIAGLQSCSDPADREPPAAAGAALFPSQEMWNSTITMTRSGKRQAVIRYAHMVQYENQDTVYFDGGLIVDFYDEAGLHTSRLTSRKGEYHERTSDVIGRDKVVVVSDSGYTLRTEEIRWDNAREKIFSDSAVVFFTPENQWLESSGFESNADLTHRVFHDAKIVTREHIDFKELERSAAAEDSSRGAGRKRP